MEWNTCLLFENIHFYCTHSIKTKISSMKGTGYVLKIAKINSQQENQPVLIANISSRKTQKIANLQNWTPAKISCHTFCPFWSGIGYDFPGTVEHEYIYLSFQFQMKIYTNSKWLLRNIFVGLINLSNDTIISYMAGLKTSMNFRGQVWKRV